MPAITKKLHINKLKRLLKRNWNCKEEFLKNVNLKLLCLGFLFWKSHTFSYITSEIYLKIFLWFPLSWSFILLELLWLVNWDSWSASCRVLNNGEHVVTEDVDNTENEPFESAHFNLEEQIYIRLKQFTTSFTFYLPK